MNIYPAYISKHNSGHLKNHTFDDTKRRRMLLSCVKKVSCIIKWNKVKTW